MRVLLARCRCPGAHPRASAPAPGLAPWNRDHNGTLHALIDAACHCDWPQAAQVVCGTGGVCEDVSG